MHALAANSDQAMFSPDWQSLLEGFEASMVRRALAAETRRAYMGDCRQFAIWATGRGMGPEAVGLRDLRRYLGVLASADDAPATIARKLAALRALLEVHRELGHRTENPADLL